MDKDELEKLSNELLFWVQGVGSVKQVEGYDCYVRHECCEQSLKEIFKALKYDSTHFPNKRLILSEWNFISKDLLPLLIFHNQDKKLSFVVLMLLIQLTELPHKDCDSKKRLQLFQHLHMAKLQFL